MDRGVLAEIDSLVQTAIENKKMPGCVVLIGRKAGIVFLKAYGMRQIEPQPQLMTEDTIFDLASLTKPVATATSVMILADRGMLRLEDPVGKYLSEFATKGKEAITVWHLLTHQSGLTPANPLKDYAGGSEAAWQRICELSLRATPGETFAYSDVGYIVLGELVRRITGRSLAEFARQEIFEPLEMYETGFKPDPALRGRIAPTEQRDGEMIRGEVHDPRAYLLGGIAGHAGLFSTAEDLWRYARMMLEGGPSGDRQILSEKAFYTMTQPVGLADCAGFRALGWDVRSRYSSNRPRGLSPAAFGHGGFTGTVIWIDPLLDWGMIFLSNRLHPDGSGSVNQLAAEIGSAAIRALVHPPKVEVLPGVEVLKARRFAPLAGRRVGLITNHTGVDRQGKPTAVLLAQAPEVELVCLFSPEHGLQGTLDVNEIPHSRHPVLGIPVYSLYGQTRRPTAEMLAGIDTLVFDIQDIGTRFYTYISTMGYAMEEAAKHGLRFVVLDRPNPVGGQVVAGPMLDPGRESFVAYHCLPVRHGMTVGELARLFCAERGLKLELEVVPLQGWSRDMLFDQTGLPWVNPSPNMRSLRAALLYPGIGLLETTNLSVGRGTETPFELFGAPWIDSEKLIAALRNAQIAGVELEPVSFTPQNSVFAHRLCHGVRMRITDFRKLDSLRLGFEIARQLRLLFPEEWDAKRYDRLLGNHAVFEAVLAGKSLGEIENLYQPDLQAFQNRRCRYLLYPPGD